MDVFGRPEVRFVAASVGLVLVGIGVLLVSGGVDTFTVTGSTQRLALVEERFTLDTDVLFTLEGHESQNNDRPSNAEVCPGREASGNHPIIRNNLVAGNLVYAARITETVSTAWPLDRTYRGDVLGDGSLITTLYLTNGNASANQQEGVSMKVDLGVPSGGPTSFSTIVTRLNVCP